MAAKRAAGRRRRRTGSFLKRHPGAIRATLVALTFFAALGLGFAFAGWALVCRGGACPSAAVLDDYTPHQTSKLYAADGRFLAEIGLERRTLVKIEQIPPVVRNAFVITEDKRFYQHGGVDFIGLVGAVKDWMLGDRLRGASTITQQLARNIFPERISRERSLIRKLKEAKVARDIEQRYSKDKILELYLNQISLGNGAYGVETAAQRYFGKPVHDLNVAEAATLAALPKAPERYNPRRYPDRAIQRRNTVIELMRRNDLITDEDASLAKAYPLQLARKSESGDLAPYFVEWVRKQLDDRFGRQLYEQGLKVYTTLDVDMQQAAERAMDRQLKSIEAGTYGKFPHQTYETYMAKAAAGDVDRAAATSPYLQGAFIAVDPRSGAVRALVGGRDFDDSKFNRATQALRQPGSTFKPIVYATAIHQGFPPSYQAEDSPIEIPQASGTPWKPQNFDFKYMGPIPMRRGLYLSRNLAAINVGRQLGVQPVIDMARRFGIDAEIPPYPSIFIGSASVQPIEMVGAYGVFASLGDRTTPHGILRVENSRGEVLWQPRYERVPVLSPEEAWLMVDMMKDVVQRGTAYQAVWNSGFHIPAGGKTGTTNDGADAWFIGYTADLVAGVWMGFDKPQKIKSNAQGGQLAAPAWTSFMKEVYQRKPAPPDWPRPGRADLARGGREHGAAGRSVLHERRGLHGVVHPGHGAVSGVWRAGAVLRPLRSGVRCADRHDGRPPRRAAAQADARHDLQSVQAAASLKKGGLWVVGMAVLDAPARCALRTGARTAHCARRTAGACGPSCTAGDMRSAAMGLLVIRGASARSRALSSGRAERTESSPRRLRASGVTLSSRVDAGRRPRRPRGEGAWPTAAAGRASHSARSLRALLRDAGTARARRAQCGAAARAHSAAAAARAHSAAQPRAPTAAAGRGGSQPRRSRAPRLDSAAQPRALPFYLPTPYSFAYSPASSSSSSWRPCSTTRPWSSTMMRSARRTVLRRCAMMIVERPRSSSSIASSTSRSLSVSRLDVASSSTTTAGFFRNTRAIARRWRWPPLSFTPRSPTRVS